MMFETEPVRITELAKETEQYLLQKGCKKSTLGVYKATWHKFIAFSSSDVYSRTAAEDFLKLYFGVDVHSAIQKLDSRMRHALRHMNALEDYLNTGAVPRKRMRGHYSTVLGLYEMFFGDFINPLLDTVIDRFGKSGAQYAKLDDTHFTITTEVRVSDQFFSWVCAFGRKAKILYPDSVAADFKAYLDKIREMYET